MVGDRFLGAPQVFAQKVVYGPFFLDLYHRVSEEGDVRCHLYADDWPNTPELDSGVFSSPSCDLKGSQCGGI